MSDATPTNGDAAFPIDARFALSIPEFCRAAGISEALYYKQQRNGTGPRVTRVGGRTLITPKEGRKWLEQLTQGAA